MNKYHCHVIRHVYEGDDEPRPPFLQTHTGPPTFTIKSAHAQNEKFCSRKEGGPYEMSVGDGVGGATVFSILQLTNRLIKYN